MNFSDALKLLKLHKCLSRPQWPTGTYIKVAEPPGREDLPFILVYDMAGKKVPWVISQVDLFATDWGELKICEHDWYIFHPHDSQYNFQQCRKCKATEVHKP